MAIVTPMSVPINHHNLLGAVPAPIYGTANPDGSTGFKERPIGTTYIQVINRWHQVVWQKVAHNGNAQDWSGQGFLTFTANVGDFTDGSSTSGTFSSADVDAALKLPIGAFIVGAVAYVHEGFTGDTTAALTIGDGSDPDRFNTGTPSVLAAGYVTVGKPSGTGTVSAAAAPVVLTVTGSADFTAIEAGSITVKVQYNF